MYNKIIIIVKLLLRLKIHNTKAIKLLRLLKVQYVNILIMLYALCALSQFKLFNYQKL